MRDGDREVRPPQRRDASGMSAVASGLGPIMGCHRDLGLEAKREDIATLCFEREGALRVLEVNLASKSAGRQEAARHRREQEADDEQNEDNERSAGDQNTLHESPPATCR